MANVLLPIHQPETGSLSLFLVIRHWEMIPDQDAHRSRYFKRIGWMQSLQKYSRISTWLRHIAINNLPPLEKDRKSEEARRLGSSYS